MTKKRLEYLDFIKGVATMLVVLAHTVENPTEYNTLLSFVMLPAFFWVSGYLIKIPAEHIAMNMLYKRTGKLLVLYCVWCLILPFTSVSHLKEMIKSPIQIIETVKVSLFDMISGKAFWFVSCLIVISVLFVLMILLTKQNDRLLATTSVILCIIGIVISERPTMIWHFDTALECQIFYVAGFLMSKNKVIERIKYEKALYVGLSALYYIIVCMGIVFLGSEKTGIDVVLNDWGVLYITIPAIIIGVSAFISLGKITNGCKFINYIGAHSLVYFALASHGMSIFNKLFMKLAEVTSVELLTNRYLINPVICVLGCLLMVIPCLFIDRFVPFLNGHFQMPIFNKKSNK